jgi:hypothetical protein
MPTLLATPSCVRSKGITMESKSTVKDLDLMKSMIRSPTVRLMGNFAKRSHFRDLRDRDLAHVDDPVLFEKLYFLAFLDAEDLHGLLAEGDAAIPGHGRYLEMFGHVDTCY